MKILFYGDSNTYGFDPRGPVPGRYDKDKIWPYIAAERIEKAEVHARGQNGRKLPSADFDFEVMFNTIRQFLPLDLFALMLGTNDYIYMPAPDMDEVIRRVEHTVDMINKEFPRQKILLIAPPPLKTANVCGMQKYDTTDGRMSKAYKNLANERGLLFFDAAAGPLSMAFDGVHLSEDGHRQLGIRLGDFLQKMNALNFGEL